VTADAKPKRRAISKKTRFEVFKRDAFACQYCGAHPPGALLHVDHILAVAAGGTNVIDNLITACAPCNLGKGARDLKAAPQSLADKAKEVQEREAQLAGYQAIFEAKRQRIEDETWRVLGYLYPGQNTVPRDSHVSVKRFIERLGVHAVLEAAEIALGAPIGHHKVWRYFCGVCWRLVRELDGTNA